jgi:hypothetical protein
MSSDLGAQLPSAVGTLYTIERELGSNGPPLVPRGLGPHSRRLTPCAPTARTI